MKCILYNGGDTISFDHTFKVAANIGYLREDEKWINEYDSLLFILNKDGKVVTWQLNKRNIYYAIRMPLQRYSRTSKE